MATKKEQSKAGISANRRGQQMGDERGTGPNKTSADKQATPALSGRRKTANKYFADDSQQAGGSDAARPRSTSPSTPGAVPTNVKQGKSGGEKVFKRTQAKKGK